MDTSRLIKRAQDEYPVDRRSKRGSRTKIWSECGTSIMKKTE